jgi:hypothetical protein
MAVITEPAVHYYGHGQAWFLPRTAGGAIDGTSTNAISLPEVDSIEISLNTEKVERMSKRDEIASKVVSFVKSVGATGKIVCSQHSMDLFKLYFFGSKATVAGGAASGVAFVPASGIVAGAYVPFPGDRTNLSTFTSIVDSAGTPATLVNGTDYEVDNQAGLVKFLNVAGFTQPFKLNGTQDAGSQVGAFKVRTQRMWLRAKVINIAENDNYGVLDAYNCQIDPATAWNLISDAGEPQKYEINFEILKDTTKSASSDGGQYFRFVE